MILLQPFTFLPSTDSRALGRELHAPGRIDPGPARFFLVWLVALPIGRIEQILDLINSAAGIVVTNFNERLCVRRVE